MSTYFDQDLIDPTEWISQVEAARLRQVTRQAISKLVKKGRIRSIQIGGHAVVYRPDVEAFTPREAGRPKKQKTEK